MYLISAESKDEQPVLHQFFLIAVQFSALNGAPQHGLSWSGVPMSVFVEKNDPRKYPANVTL